VRLKVKAYARQKAPNARLKLNASRAVQIASCVRDNDATRLYSGTRLNYGARTIYAVRLLCNSAPRRRRARRSCCAFTIEERT
jgi:hypothetical protein